MTRPLGATAIVFALLALPVAATTIAIQSLDQMCAGADRIVRGRIASATCERDTPTGPIWTTYRVEVLESLKSGLAPGSTMTLRQIGGTLGGDTLEAPGIPQFLVGDEAILFTKDYGGGWQSVANAWQGAIPVLREAGPAGALVQPTTPSAPRLFGELASADLASVEAAISASVARQGGAR